MFGAWHGCGAAVAKECLQRQMVAGHVSQNHAGNGSKGVSEWYGSLERLL